ncbi:MAG TPA: hypothetical protein VMN36_03195 [Verrucomicrobiales bacterium]|nr:hypothetical protein [Verrucomicrobiales bacterium]
MLCRRIGAGELADQAIPFRPGWLALKLNCHLGDALAEAMRAAQAGSMFRGVLLAQAMGFFFVKAVQPGCLQRKQLPLFRLAHRMKPLKQG